MHHYEERRPSPALAPYVQCFWTLSRTYQPDQVGEVLWPDGCQELIFHYGAAYSIDGQMLPNAFFIGMLSRYHHLYADGNVKLFGIRLLPWTLAAMTDKPAGSFKDRFVPLTEVLPARLHEQLREVENRLRETEDVSAAQEMLEALDLFQGDRLDPAIMKALHNLYADPLNYDVARTVEESGYSQRQLERRCAEITGLTLKRLHMIARFNQARLRLMFQPDLDLLECMLEFGYYDYPHFSKDFKLCLGITPAQYCRWVRQMRQPAGGSKHVVFLQDEP